MVIEILKNLQIYTYKLDLRSYSLILSIDKNKKNNNKKRNLRNLDLEEVSQLEYSRLLLNVGWSKFPVAMYNH